MKLTYTFLIVLLGLKAFSQSNSYPTTGNPVVYDYSPGLTLQRNTASGGYIQGIQTKLQNGTNNWFFGNLDADQWMVAKGDYQFPKFIVSSNGNVGIGTGLPSGFLHVVGNSTSLPELQIDHYQNNLGATTLAFRRARGTKNSPLPIINQDYVIGIEGWDYVGSGYSNGFRRNSYIVSQANGTSNTLGTDIIFATSSGGPDASEGMRLDKNGNLGVGISNPTEKLAVNGKIRAKEIKVDVVNWPDYVFEENYHVRTLKELKRFIKDNKHLPELPTAKDVENDGIDLGEMNKLLMKKIEELTLHLIEKDEQLQDEIRKNVSQEKRIISIENVLKVKKIK